MPKFTIIIPTFNRPGYLRRLLSYYNSFNEKFKIIVADSSSDSNKKLNKEIVAAFPDLGISYRGDYASVSNAYPKFADAVNSVGTDYCVFCADDDFITPNGIKQSVDFLEKNPDFTIAQGRQIGFRIRSGKGKKQQFRWKFADPPVSIEFLEPEERLDYHLSNYSTSTIYGVHRTDILNMIYDEVLKSEVDPYLFTELLTSMLTLVYGKMKCLDVLYGARSEETINTNTPNLRDAIAEGSFDTKYPKFRDCLSTHLTKKSRLGPKESSDLVDKSMSAYLHKHMMRPIVPIPKSKKRTLLDALPLPRWMHSGIIASYATLYKALIVKPPLLYNALFIKPAFPLSKHRDDFNKIRLHVLFHSGTIYDEIAKSSITL